MLNDLRYALRQLVKSPGFTFVAVITIALGIGANTAVFSVMNAVLLRSLPVPDAQQLVFFHLRNQPLSTSQSGYDDTSLPMPVFEAMRDRRDIFSDVTAFAPLGFGKVAVRFGAEPEVAHGELVSGNFFSALGVQPALGRSFNREDEAHNAPIVILSHRWWTTRFHSSKTILGQPLYVRGVVLTIVGVAPTGFDGADPGQPDMDFWLPLQRNTALNPWGNAASDGTLYGKPSWLCLLMIGRLQPGVSAAQASSALTPLFRRTLAEASPVSPKDRAPELILTSVRGIATLADDYEHPLRVLMGMVALVLLIACANVAMLLILRNAAKAREFALRRALGAGARVLFGHLISESVLLATAGCALAWFFAGAATDALTRWSGLDFTVAPDKRVLLFTVAVSAAVAVAFGLVPMRAATSVPLIASLRVSSAFGAGTHRRYWGRQLVVSLQISMCAVLLYGGALLYSTLRNLESRDLGMRTPGILLFGVRPQADVKNDEDAIRFHQRVLQAVRALPGVETATMSAVRLGSGESNNDGVLVDGNNPAPSRPIAPMRVNEVGSHFLGTLGIAIEQGRDIEEQDILGSNKVALINRTFADRYLPNTNPLGHQIAFFGTPKVGYTIIGVARNSRYTGVKESDRPMAYLPFTQVPGIAEMQYIVRTSTERNRVLADAARVVRDIDPDVPLDHPVTLREQFNESISQERLIARISLCFAVLATFLVLVGLYGTISYGVSRRTAEIGVRMALGAQKREVLGMVLRESATLTLLGLAISLPLAFALARALRSMLFGLSAADPMACLAALVGIGMVAVAGSLIPAKRALAIDPSSALRGD